jgi:hypothetical protein
VPFYRQQWCHSSSSSSTKVAAHGLHHFINGWCNYHLQWQPSLLRLGCTSHCLLMANPNRDNEFTSFRLAFIILVLIQTSHPLKLSSPINSSSNFFNLPIIYRNSF